MRRFPVLISVLATACLLSVQSMGQTAVDATFTYQGQLKQGAVPVSDFCDFEFLLFTADVGGTQVGSTQLVAGVLVDSGLFAVELNFGPTAFSGDQRFLNVAVQCTDDVAPITLSPRLALTATPYASTAMKTVGVDGHSLDASDGIPIDAVRVDYQGKVLMEKGGLTVFDDQGQGISLTSDTFEFIEGTSEDPVYAYSSTDDTHEFYTNGTRQMIISAAGNVGIGMNWGQDPSAKLHIGGTQGVDGLMFPDGTLQTTAAVGGGDSLWSESGNDIFYDTGNVGIGTNNPTQRLHIVGPPTEGAVVQIDTVGEDATALNIRATGYPGFGIVASATDTAIFGSSPIEGGTFYASGVGGRGLAGIANAATGAGKGVYGRTNSPDGYAGYFEGRGYFSGDVGIGQSNPLTTLHLGGTPSVDGLMFPDGTLQTTAAVGGGGDSLWSPAGTDIFYNAGSVGIGTSSPQSRLHVIDPTGFAIMGECLGEGTSGYLGHEYAGVYGESSSPTGYGGWFEGRGYFRGDLKVGGNLGIGTSSPTRPLHVEGNGSDVIYAKTTATSTFTRAVRGDNISLAGAGVSGEAMANSGTAAGVMGGAQSPNGVGVLGYNDNEEAPAIGVHGVTVSPTGFGGYFEGRGYFSGNVGIGTSAPESKLHIVGPNDAINGPILTLEADAADRTESGRIRFGESTGNFRFIREFRERRRES